MFKKKTFVNKAIVLLGKYDYLFLSINFTPLHGSWLMLNLEVAHNIGTIKNG